MKIKLTPVILLAFFISSAAVASTWTSRNHIYQNSSEEFEGPDVDNLYPTYKADPRVVGNHTYYFNQNSSQIRESDKQSIEIQGKFIAVHPRMHVLLEGFSDERGSRPYNIALAEKRTKSFVQALQLAGVALQQIRIISYGSEKPAAYGFTEEDYQLNRRVNLILIGAR